jgi:putative two-component system response regulator
MLNSRILVVDDEPSNAALLVRVLKRAGYENVLATTDSEQIVPLINEHDPHLVVTDLHMGSSDGFTVLEAINKNNRDALLPVLVVTADCDVDSLRRARELGADDYLLKPFRVADLVVRVEGLLMMRAACESQESDSKWMRNHIGACRHIVTEAELDLLGHVTGTSEGSDPTDGHCARVGELAGAIAQEMKLSQDVVDAIRAAAPLHDVGKVAVSDSILSKPGPLTESDRVTIGRHTVIGGFMLSGTELPLLDLAREIALYHHERWDGTGYPRGLVGEDIPLSARIVAVADVFDALTSERSYKRAWTVRETMQEIVSKSGTQFDPRVVGALIATIFRRDSLVPPADNEDSSTLSLVDRQRQREAQLQAAIAAGHYFQRAGAGLVGDVSRRAIVA